MSTPPPLTQREYWNGKVGEEWVTHADRLDTMLKPLGDAALDALKLRAGESVLDIGCGAGATTMEIAKRVSPNGRAVGIDLSKPLIDLGGARAKASGVAISLAEADASADAFPGAPFDAAFSRFGVMFFDQPVEAFTHIRSTLRPGGRLAFVCWRAMHENAWGMTAIEAVLPMLKAPLTPPNPDAPGPFAFADKDKIARVLAASGWDNATIAPWDGSILAGGGGDANETAAFMLKIGPCGRAIADQNLDEAEALRRVAEKLAPLQTPAGVALHAACWIVKATA